MKKFSASKWFFLLLSAAFIVMFFSAFFLTRYSAIYHTDSTEKQGNESVPTIREHATALPAPTPTPEVTPQPQPVAVTSLLMPVEGEITQHFSADTPSYNPSTGDWQIHSGIDIAGTQDQVTAAADGIVSSVSHGGILGDCVTVDHPGDLQTVYCGLKEIHVVENQSVTAREPIGSVGIPSPLEEAAGVHLHFEVRREGVTVDPEEFFR